MTNSPAGIVNSTTVASALPNNGSVRLALLWSTSLIVAVAFSVIEPGLQQARTANPLALRTNSEAGHSVHNAEESNLESKQLAFLAFGLWGFGLLLYQSPQLILRFAVTLWLVAAIAAAAMVNLACTNTAFASIAQFVETAGIVIGVLGLARQFSLRELARLTLVVASWHLACSVISEFAAGAFRPEISSYRFAGTLSPDIQGIHCALLVLSALALMRRSTRNLHLLVGLIGLGMLFLILTKSPTSCSAFLMAIIVTAALEQSGYLKWIVGFAAICIFIPPVVEMSELLRIEKLASNVGNESLLTWPVLGPCLLAPAALFALCGAQQRFQSTQDEGYRFLVAQIVIALMVTMTDTYYLTPSFGAFVCATSIARLVHEGWLALPIRPRTYLLST